MSTDGSSRSGRPVRLAAAVGASIVAVLAALLAATPAFIVGPGPVISITDGLVVDGADAEEVIDGEFLFTTIEAESVRAWRGLTVIGDPERRLVGRTAIVPDGLSDDEFLAIQQGRFDESVDAAARAAGDALGGEVPDVDFDGGIVGGPSAGLLIALAIHDAASPADVAAGRRISGTGEVASDGTVTSVGSIAFKVRGAAEEGADVFLVPSAQLQEARAAVPDDAAMEVIAVDTVATAVAVLEGAG